MKACERGYTIQEGFPHLTDDCYFMKVHLPFNKPNNFPMESTDQFFRTMRGTMDQNDGLNDKMRNG